MLDPRVCAEIEAPPHLVRTYEDSVRGYRGIIVLDSLACGTSHGGLRLRSGVTVDEVRRLARVMTWKYRYVGLPNGGAKAAIEGPEDLPREEKARRLRWLAEAASDLFESGTYSSGPDLGTDDALIGEMVRSRGFLQGRREFPTHVRGSGFYTALSAVVAAEAALARRKQSFRGARVAIEGFGAVGTSAARLVAQRGGRVVAISNSTGAAYQPAGLDIDRIVASRSPLQADPRAGVIALPDLLRLDVDVLLLCGPGGTVDAAMGREISAPIVSPGANAPYTFEALEILHDRGIVALPDFVANCGGILSASLRVTGLHDRSIEAFVRTVYRRRVASLLDRVAARGRPPTEVALATLAPLRGQGERREDAGGLSAVRRIVRGRLVPRALLAGPALVYFAARLGVPVEATPST